MTETARAVRIAGSETTYRLHGKQEIVFERIYDASREAVFKAFTDPKRIPDWWGPTGSMTTVETMEVRTGGVWRFTMNDANGNKHTFSGVYRVVDAPKRVVCTLEYGMPGAPAIEETYEFIEQGAKTLLRLTSTYPSGSALGGMLSVGMDAAGPWIEGSRHQWRLDRLSKIVRK